MKKLIVLFLLFAAAQASAQRFGINAGLARTTYSAVGKIYRPGYGKTDISTSGKMGITLGAFADVALNKHLVLRPGLQLVKKGALEDYTLINNATPYRFTQYTNFTALDLPVNIFYKMKTGRGHFLLGGGVVPSLLTDEYFDGFDFGANVLTGYELPNGFSMNVTYTHGFTNVASNADHYESLKNRHLGIVLGYTFPRQLPAKAGDAESGTEPPQEPSRAMTALFAELGGPGGVPSVNFDTRFTKTVRGWGFRMGIGLLVAPDASGFGIPAAFNYLVGQQTHFFEMSAGAGYYHLTKSNVSGWYDFPKENSVVPFVWLGYRYQPAAKRFFFRTGFNQMLSRRTGVIQNFPVPSLSFGYSVQ